VSLTYIYKINRFAHNQLTWIKPNKPLLRNRIINYKLLNTRSELQFARITTMLERGGCLAEFDDRSFAEKKADWHQMHQWRTLER